MVSGCRRTILSPLGSAVFPPEGIGIAIQLVATSGEINPSVASFLATIRFHYMACGALFAYWHFRHDLSNSLINHRWVTLVVAVTVAAELLFDSEPQGEVLASLFFATLYSFLIVNTATGKSPWINLEQKTINYLGRISFGIYMYHMCVDYVLRTGGLKLNPELYFDPYVYLAAYTLVLLGCTVMIAAVSYRHIEMPIMKMKRRANLITAEMSRS